jgi:peptidoglycan DL-endopeptidase CwlO
VTKRDTGRHRAPARHASPALALSPANASTGAVAKTGAVLAVSGGLVASLGLQANAATLSTVETTPRTAGLDASASALPIGLASGVLAAPQYGEIGFTAKAAPKPKSKPKPRTVAEVLRGAPSRQSDRVSRSADRAPAPVKVAAGAPGSAQFGASVLSIAARYAGTPYVFGGTTPAGFDCSGFVGYVFNQVGISLPRTSSAQRAATTRISRSEAVAGDLVFMPGHVGIYAGNGMMWDSPHTGDVVSKRAVYSSSATYGRVG